jgi:hypothetical protein
VTNAELVLGPLIRHVDETSASIWVETSDTAQVVVRAVGRTWEAATFAVHGHHYALVEVDGLHPGTVADYAVEIDDTPVWPEPGSAFPPSSIATLEPGKPLRLAFGSCRTSVGHDRIGNLTHGVDALRAYALRMAESKGERGKPHEPVHWPDLLLFLGDQVYADDTSKEMQEFIKSRRDVDEPPGEELKDYEEYAHLYRLAWTEPANRWLLSTLPSAMVFDDHDIRDDWNTSASWKKKMESTSWWHERIVSGLASYWVYQHLGNLSPAERAQDEVWQRVVQAGTAEVDLTDVLDELAERVDQQPETYRWSHARQVGDVRLVVIDSRAARVLEPSRRALLDPSELEWLDDKMRGDCRHLLIGTSLPFLLPRGLHHLESWNEAVASGSWGGRAAGIGEKLRQGVDFEHWAAFEATFQKVARMAVEVAEGRRGTPPETVTFLSGDVHHSYVAEVDRPLDGPAGVARSRILQAVCSPVRNPLPRPMRFAMAFLSYGLATPLGALAARSAKVPDPPFLWRTLHGPWFDNNLATLEETDDGLEMWWETGVVVDGDHDHPAVEEVARVQIGAPDQETVVIPGSRSARRRRPVRAGRSRRPH